MKDCFIFCSNGVLEIENHNVYSLAKEHGCEGGVMYNNFE